MKRNIALDILKLILAFMVVGIHAGFLDEITKLGNYLTENGIFRMAVPIFFMINGYYFYTVLSKEKTLYWFKRVLQLYLFWMLIYIYFWFEPTGAFLAGFIKTVHTLLVGYLHLWYFPAMMGAAFLVLFVKKLPLSTGVAIILFIFITGVSIEYIGNYHMVDNAFVDMLCNKNHLYRNFLFFAFPFFFTGFLINKFQLQEQVSLRQAIRWSIVGFVLLLSESYLNYLNPLKEGGLDLLYSLLLLAPALFLLFMKFDLQGKSKQLSLYATGIYVVHLLFLMLYEKYAHFGGTVLTFVVIVSSLVASYFLIKINNRVKFIL